MHTNDLLNHDIRQGFWLAFSSVSHAAAAAIKAGNIRSATGGLMMMFVLLLVVIRAALRDPVAMMFGLRSWRRFDNHLSAAAGIVLAAAAIIGLGLSHVIR